MTKVVMIDVDGVLVRGRPQDGRPLFTDLEADLGLSLDRLREAFFAPRWAEIVTGQKPLRPELAAVLAEIAPDLAVDRLIAYWFENDSRIDQDLLAALAPLRQRGLRLFLATNQEHMRAAYLMDAMGLSSHVDGIIYSAALGHRKPDAAFFRLATERAGVAPADILFIDDTLENLDAARRFGWEGLHWRDDSKAQHLARLRGLGARPV